MKKLKTVFVLLFVVLLAVPAVTINTEKNVASELNNAMLPELDRENLTADTLNSYIQDRIGFHDAAITGYINTQSKVFHELEHPSYCYGNDGYVFFKLGESSVDTDFIDAFCKYLRQIQDYCEARNVPFLYCINPSKTTVYSRYLPDGYHYQNIFLETLYEKLENYGVNWISNAELLTEKSKTEQVFNRQYDAGHWNDLGEFYGTNHLLEAIHDKFPAVEPWNLSDFSVTEKVEPYLPNSKISINESVPKFTFQVPEVTMSNTSGEYDGISLHRSYQTLVTFQRTDAEAASLPRVLFFHGSYYNRNRDFYAHAFQEAYDVHNYQNLLDFDYYFNIFQPDCVLLETAEYATSRGYFDYQKMINTQFNEPLKSVLSQLHQEILLKDLSPEVEYWDRLCKLSFQTQEPYKFGYLATENGTYDLIPDGQLWTCTIDQTQTDISNAKVYLFS